MEETLQFNVDRKGRTSLVKQIASAVRIAISEGRIRPGARLPSWDDLSVQLGVSRGTVRSAYERLADERLVVTAGASGTFAAEFCKPKGVNAFEVRRTSPDDFPPLAPSSGIFHLGMPAHDAFPVKVWARMLTRAARASASSMISYPDPHGEAVLRVEIAAYLSLARGLSCSPSQILITNGYAGALGLLIQALGLRGTVAWMEDPGYPLARRALVLNDVTPIPVSVDAEGLNVKQAIQAAPIAAFAIVTAGQQAPLGVTMSAVRRIELLEWARQTGAWIIEDDYLSELQLEGRPAPALASLDTGGRVIHIGTFSKTISPSLRLGFVVLPKGLVETVGEAAAALAPAPPPMIQNATAEFMIDGHYLRHLRRMKKIYANRRGALAAQLTNLGAQHLVAGLSVLLPLPEGADDIEVARKAFAVGLSPIPLSPWYATRRERRHGLLLGVTNLPDAKLAHCCDQLLGLI